MPHETGPAQVRATVDAAEEVKVDPKIAALNQTYALVLIGDKAVIMKEGESPDGRPDVNILSLSAFGNWFGNQFVNAGKRKKTLAAFWLTHRHRRQYEGLIFAPGREVPGHYNLWRGFAVKPGQGDCSKFLAHIKENICRGDDALFDWVVGWFAEIVQHPERKSGTSLAIRGKQGTGKTIVGKTFGALLGVHYVAVADPRYITGRFNSHLVSCLILHADEGFWAGDHAAEGKLKDLITGETHLVEFKGKEPIRLRNYVRLFVTGNPDWVVPAGMEERRFAVLEIGEVHMRDIPYFAAIEKEMDEGGREALLDYLLKFDLEKINLRVIPRTDALLDQKIASLTAEQGWWIDVLQSGRLPYGCGAPCECPVALLFDRYVAHASKAGARRRSIETRLGIFLKSAVPGLIKREGVYRNCNRQDEEGSVYEFPELAKCRSNFSKMLEHEFQWNGPKEWLPEPEPPARTEVEAGQHTREPGNGQEPPRGWRDAFPPVGEPSQATDA